jgi:signal transduction histidine kinase
LFIARRESGEVRLKTREIDLVTLLRAAIATCRSMEGGRGASVVFRTELGAALTAADPDRLRQVLVILLDNALRYGGRHVEVRLDRGSGGHVIIVSDDGPGLSTEDLAQAFKRFYRGTNAAERYHRGTGLGLTVAKAIVEAHKGEIAIDSQPDHGVRVTVMLPGVPRLRLAS